MVMGLQILECAFTCDVELNHILILGTTLCQNISQELRTHQIRIGQLTRRVDNKSSSSCYTFWCADKACKLTVSIKLHFETWTLSPIHVFGTDYTFSSHYCNKPYDWELGFPLEQMPSSLSPSLSLKFWGPSGLNYLSQDYIILDVPKLLKNQKNKFLIGRMIWVILYQPSAIRALSISFKDRRLVSTNARYEQELQEGTLLQTPNMLHWFQTCSLCSNSRDW